MCDCARALPVPVWVSALYKHGNCICISAHKRHYFRRSFLTLSHTHTGEQVICTEMLLRIMFVCVRVYRKLVLVQASGYLLVRIDNTSDCYDGNLYTCLLIKHLLYWVPPRTQLQNRNYSLKPYDFAFVLHVNDILLSKIIDYDGFYLNKKRLAFIVLKFKCTKQIKIILNWRTWKFYLTRNSNWKFL